MSRKAGADRSFPFAEGGEATIAVVTGGLGLVVGVWRRAKGGGRWVAGLLMGLTTVLWGLVLYFFRDPRRVSPQEAGLVVSPADGQVVEIVEEEVALLPSPVKRISIFLSVWDVHVQRTPIAGTVRSIIPRPGKFLQAFRPEASSENESISMVLDTAYGQLMVKQIAGILARRCVNYAQLGDQLQTGQRFGLIRFGSRVDLFLPLSAQLLIKEGDQVKGGITPFAYLVTSIPSAAAQ